MKTYAQFRPTGFDQSGAFLSENQEWLVLPVMQTRDSGALDRSNFACAIRELGGESNTVEVHRFGHWGPGWFEIIIVKPDTPQAKTAQEIEDSLSDYPVLDESHYSDLEYTEACEYWARMSIRDRMDECIRAGISIFSARRDYMPEDPNGRLYEHLTSD